MSGFRLRVAKEEIENGDTYHEKWNIIYSIKLEY